MWRGSVQADLCWVEVFMGKPHSVINIFNRSLETQERSPIRKQIHVCLQSMYPHCTKICGSRNRKGRHGKIKCILVECVCTTTADYWLADICLCQPGKLQGIWSQSPLPFLSYDLSEMLCCSVSAGCATKQNVFNILTETTRLVTVCNSCASDFFFFFAFFLPPGGQKLLIIALNITNSNTEIQYGQCQG